MKYGWCKTSLSWFYCHGVFASHDAICELPNDEIRDPSRGGNERPIHDGNHEIKVPMRLGVTEVEIDGPLIKDPAFSQHDDPSC